MASETYGHFESSFDASQGGFGGAPKFPTPVQLLFLLDYYGYGRTHKEIPEHDAETALDMVLYTLEVSWDYYSRLKKFNKLPPGLMHFCLLENCLRWYSWYVGCFIMLPMTLI